VLALVLAALARPFAVGLTLNGSSLSRAERAFIAWSGLKGAVPLITTGILNAVAVSAAVGSVALVALIPSAPDWALGCSAATAIYLGGWRGPSRSPAPACTGPRRRPNRLSADHAETSDPRRVIVPAGTPMLERGTSSAP
jgi:hypothetical protein